MDNFAKAKMETWAAGLLSCISGIVCNLPLAIKTTLEGFGIGKSVLRVTIIVQDIATVSEYSLANGIFHVITFTQNIFSKIYELIT